MDENRLKEIVREGINDLILVYQEEAKIEDGGVEPLKLLELNSIEERLTSWIREVFPWA